MSTKKTIRTIFLFVSIGLGLYQAAQVFEVIDAAKKPGGLSKALGSLPIDPGLLKGLTSTSDNPQDILNSIRNPPPVVKETKAEDLVVFAADGHQLSAKEKEELQKTAARHRPKPKKTMNPK